MNTTIEMHKAELLQMQSLPEYQKTKEMNKLLRWSIKWAPKGRRTQLQAIRRSDGTVTQDPDEAMDILIEHWSGTFAEQPVDIKLALKFLKEHAVPLPSINWTLTFEQFCKVVKRMLNSAPGPDGLPYAVWQCCPEMYRRVLYIVYTDLLDGRPLPAGFNHAFLAVLAKGSDDMDDTIVSRAPEDTRPLSLSNSDAKLVASAFKVAAEETVQNWACSSQRGFLKGRVLIDNVITVETEGMVASMPPDSRAVMLFLDFAAAFPSVAHAFIWMTLVMLKVPVRVIKAMQQLYKDNLHFIRFAGCTKRAFLVLAGVKQGCPLSGLLFVIVCDSLLRALCKQIRLPGVIGAFADDIAIVTSQVWLVLPGLRRLFKMLAKISCLNLKMKKCVLVPLWEYQLRNVQALLTEIVPSWANMQIASYAKYLGFFIGPGARDLSWNAPAQKYEERCREVRARGLGLVASAHFYNQLCITVLSFIGQLSYAPRRVLSLESKMVQTLAAGPYNALTPPLLQNLDSVCLPVYFKAVQVQNLAAMVRAANSTSKVFSAELAKLVAASYEMESAVLPRLRWWYDSGIVKSLESAVAFVDGLSAGVPTQTQDSRIQKHIADLVRPAISVFDLAAFLRLRLARWSQSDETITGLDQIVQQAIHVLRQLHNMVPPCVIVSVLRTWCNGWCTSRRFGDEILGCLYSSDCLGDDELEHYCVCTSTQHYLRAKLRVDARDMSSLTFLLLSGDRDVPLSLRAAHIHAALGVFNSCRHKGSPSTQRQMDDMMWERWRAVLTQSAALSRTYTQWVSSSRGVYFLL